MADHPRSRGVYRIPTPFSRAVQGSSPLARGLHRDLKLLAAINRIIPARAGFTPSRRRRMKRTQDHPRSRGVYRAFLGDNGLSQGSSPLARGLLEAGAVVAVPVGIIPARAGFTAVARSYVARVQDHPRSRGVYKDSRDART